MQGSESGYRAVIHEAVPSIKVLDDVVLAEEGGGDGEVKGDIDNLDDRSTAFTSDAGMQKDWQILQLSIKQGLLLEQGKLCVA